MFLSLLIKGFVIGIAFIIPGVSGGTLAIYLGVYDKLLHAIGHVFKEFKQSVRFLLPLFIGIGLSIVALAKLLGILIEWNSYITLMFFIGLIIGGVPSILKKVGKDKIKLSGVLSFVFAFSLVIILIVSEKISGTTGISTFQINFANFMLLVLLGMVASITMIVPGISGSAMLVTLGFYTAIVTNVIGNIFDFTNITYHLFVIIPFGLGALIGIILFSKVIEFFLHKYPKETYLAITGFVIASVIAIFLEIRDPLSGGDFTNQLPIYTRFWSYISKDILVSLSGVISMVIGIVGATLLVKLELHTK